ncbi:hypothetical protein [Vibrio gallicus]|uniref:hypothetical protein n=1 Tax=Vibrio gallicus TaxID=190897 RepID=UPI0021C3DDC8|nr:hypothetical protein [Vibrio gallicus]
MKLAKNVAVMTLTTLAMAGCNSSNNDNAAIKETVAKETSLTDQSVTAQLNSRAIRVFAGVSTDVLDDDAEPKKVPFDGTDSFLLQGFPTTYNVEVACDGDNPVSAHEKGVIDQNFNYAVMYNEWASNTNNDKPYWAKARTNYDGSEYLGLKDLKNISRYVAAFDYAIKTFSALQTNENYHNNATNDVIDSLTSNTSEVTMIQHVIFESDVDFVDFVDAKKITNPNGLNDIDHVTIAPKAGIVELTGFDKECQFSVAVVNGTAIALTQAEQLGTIAG